MAEVEPEGANGAYSDAPAPGDPHRYGEFSPERDVRDLHALYYKHFGDRRKERQLFSTGAFFTTFAAVRGITHAIRAERGPFKNITPGGRHIHHMTFGITGLLSVGYLVAARDRHRRGPPLLARRPRSSTAPALRSRSTSSPSG